jgi:hypothetical protein
MFPSYAIINLDSRHDVIYSGVDAIGDDVAGTGHITLVLDDEEMADAPTSGQHDCGWAIQFLCQLYKCFQSARSSLWSGCRFDGFVAVPVICDIAMVPRVCPSAIKSISGVSGFVILPELNGRGDA